MKMKIEKGWLLIIAELAVALTDVLRRQPSPSSDKKEGDQK